MPIPADTALSENEQEKVAQEVLRNYSDMYVPDVRDLDTTKSINYWRISRTTGEIIKGDPDTTLTDYTNRTLVEGHSVSMSYLGNLGSPALSRIFFERGDRGHFMFTDPYRIYSQSPEKFNFINTKIPFSNLTYQSGGGKVNKEERLDIALSTNFGKSLNIGFDVNYLYSKGSYPSQSAKRLDLVLYGSYIADRHHLHLFINPSNFTNAENGGIYDDRYITSPESIDDRNYQTTQIPTNFTDTWNRLNNSNYYLTYRYNLGFERDTENVDEEGETIKQFIPVSSIIYTFDYNTQKRHFDSKDSLILDSLYNYVPENPDLNRAVNDSTSYWSLKNTVGISLREGFSHWAKFDLTAYISQDIRKYKLMGADNNTTEDSQSSTYIGGEIYKKKGKILRYDAKGELGVAGYNIGDFNVSGNIETFIPLFNKMASVKATGYIKNLSPTYYENKYYSKYYKWDNRFNKTKKVYVGGTINFPQTKTSVKVGVENITDYIYFDYDGKPSQTGNDIQIFAATLEQNMKLGALHWDNQLVYQTSSEEDIIPLPELSLYSNLYLQFKVAKVLTIQMGGNVHYFTKYYSPTYDAATQQFKLQNETKVGEYPLLNAYVNCHLKYTRFFIQFYNLSSSFIDNPAYFSLPHYPVNPQIFKFGLSWNFNN